jgi:hypothetical protein
MFINQAPATGTVNGEIRYFTFVSWDHKECTFQKVMCRRRWPDKVNGGYATTCGVLDDYSVPPQPDRIGKRTTVDSDWVLQRTYEDAARLLIMQLFNNKSSFEEKPVWEL